MPKTNKDNEYRRDPADKCVAKAFLGWVPNSDPHDLPLGASPYCVNVSSIRPGELCVRRGAGLLRFDRPR